METGRHRARRGGEGGFSLIELMVVIAIIAMLAAIVGFNVLNALGKGERATAQNQISNFKTALINYRLELKKFPSTEEGLKALVENEKGIKFLDQKEVPLDPWNHPYVYRLESGTEFVIVSYGADGQEGGTGENADISSDTMGAKEEK
jgi:general secretion pathway protein G